MVGYLGDDAAVMDASSHLLTRWTAPTLQVSPTPTPPHFSLFFFLFIFILILILFFGLWTLLPDWETRRVLMPGSSFGFSFLFFFFFFLVKGGPGKKKKISVSIRCFFFCFFLLDFSFELGKSFFLRHFELICSDFFFLFLFLYRWRVLPLQQLTATINVFLFFSAISFFISHKRQSQTQKWIKMDFLKLFSHFHLITEKFLGKIRNINVPYCFPIFFQVFLFKEHVRNSTKLFP